MTQPRGGESPEPLGLATTSLRAMFDHSKAVFYVKDRNTRHHFVNRSFERVFGLPYDTVVGKTNAELFPEVADELTAHDRGVFENGGSNEYEEWLPVGGEPRLFLARRFSLFDDDGQMVGLFGIATDATDLADRRSNTGLRRELDVLRQLVESSADGILAFDTDYRYTVWNPRMENISGLRASQVIGQRALEVFPYLVQTGEVSYFYEALAGRDSSSIDRPFVIPKSGHHGTFEARYSPLHDGDGRVVGGLGIIRDVTERQQAERERLELARAETARVEAEAVAGRFAFLAEAGEALSSSLDDEEILRKLARLALPILGDACVVDVVDGSELRRLVSAHVNPAKTEMLNELRIRYPLDPSSPQPAGRALRSGQPELVAEVTLESLEAHARDAEHVSLLRRIGFRSHLAVPLIARGVTVGVITLGISESDRRYGPTDVALATELARRAALAVDNARLYRSAQRELAERRRVEEALRVSESRFRAVIEQSPLSIQIFTSDGSPVRVNEASEKLWGNTLDWSTDYNVRNDPQFAARGVATHIERAFGGDAVEIPVIRYEPGETPPSRSQHGEAVRWVRAFAYPIKDADGMVREVVLLQEDATARFHAEEQLRVSEERLRVALEGARMHVWDWDVLTDNVHCSESAEQLWGIHVGKAADFMAVVHPEDRELLQLTARDAAAGQTSFRSEYRLLSAGGRIRWVESRGRVEPNANGRAVRVMGVTADITDKRAAEEATRVLADAGAALCASLDVSETLDHLVRVMVPRLADYCIFDLLDEGETLKRVAAWHPAPERMARAMELFERFPPRRSDDYGPGRVIQTGRPEWAEQVTDEILHSVAQDDEHLALLRGLELSSYICMPLVVRGVVFGVFTLVHAESRRVYRASDVSLANDLALRTATAIDNARLYQRLREEDRRKDEFLATLAHELRNPLAPIRSGLEVVRFGSTDAKTNATTAIMERQLTHMVRMVDDLLDLSRVTRGDIALHLERIELAAVVNTALEVSGSVIAVAGLELAIRLPDKPIVLLGDLTRLAQVFSNLLNNAAKYTPRGGRVEVEAKRDGNGIVIFVRDTGQGIRRDMLTRVFEMFMRGDRASSHDHGGLGIGLSLVHRIVELHGGSVWAESDGPDLGSTFFVRLPSVGMESSPQPEEPSTEVHVRRDRRTRRILVVDDNIDAAEMLAMLLEFDGHEVRKAASGPEALEVVDGFHPEIAFLDVGLPGMNGHELAGKLREQPSLDGILLVAITGWGQPEDRRRSREAGFDHHLTKPVTAQALLLLVASVEDRRRSPHSDGDVT